MSNREAVFLEIFLSPMGKKEVDWLCSEALLDPAVFEFFFEQIRNATPRIAWHAAWVLEKVSEADPDRFTESQNRQLVELTAVNQHDGLQRIVLSILLNIPLLQPISVDFINQCFEKMLSPKETVGVQVLSMKLLEQICVVEPDFKPELFFSLENTDDELYSRGYIAAKKNLLKRLKMNM